MITTKLKTILDIIQLFINLVSKEEGLPRHFDNDTDVRRVFFVCPPP